MSKVNMSSKVLIFCLVFLMVIVPMVSAVPPVSTVQQFQEGYNFKYPTDQYLKQGEDYEFEIHVFNLSNGMPITTGISCYFHLYNSTGKHQLELYDDAVSHMFDFSFFVAGGNFSVGGDYYYLVQCNNSVLGGFVEVPFEVTPKGIEVTVARSFIGMGLNFFILLCLFGIVMLFLTFDNLLAKVGLFGLGYMGAIVFSFISWGIAGDFLFTAGMIATTFKWVFILLTIGAFPLLIGAFAWWILMVFKIKEIQRMVDRGIPYSEAERRTGRKFR